MLKSVSMKLIIGAAIVSGFAYTSMVTSRLTKIERLVADLSDHECIGRREGVLALLRSSDESPSWAEKDPTKVNYLFTIKLAGTPYPLKTFHNEADCKAEAKVFGDEYTWQCNKILAE